MWISRVSRYWYLYKPCTTSIFWSLCSSSILFIRLITYRQYIMENFGEMLLSPHQYLTSLTTFCNYYARPWQSKGRPWTTSILADAITNDSSSSFRSDGRPFFFICTVNFTISFAFPGDIYHKSTLFADGKDSYFVVVGRSSVYIYSRRT